ncbi:protein zer-1 homolog [Ptychodera flava]|uniref:protein zer-1 homolog n=1 Tax=Ptychodera flava TaxID=63121 RepID=UPI00396A8782
MEAAAVNRDESQEMPGSCTCNPDLYYPESLFNYAKVVSFRCPKALFQIDETGAAVRLRPNICLPSLIMDELLMHFVKDGKVDNAFLYLLGQAENISLKCAALHGCDDISDDGLKALFKHNLQSLDISDCSGVTAKTMENLLRCKDSLQHLNIDFCRGIITKEVMQNFNFTNLMSLNVNSIQLLKFETHLVEQFFSQLKNLTSLDMSNQVQVHSTKSLDFLNLVAGQLQSLVLYNCKPKLITDSWNIICSMPRLQHLDVSQEPTGMTFGQPRFLTNVITPQMLSKLAESTPTLRSLDISRHNLGSWDEELADESDPNVYVQSSIPGLKRLRRPLDFIGMWMTRWIDGVPPNEDQRRQRSKHTHVPAEKVAGGLTKDTLLVALEVYTERRRRFSKS